MENKVINAKKLSAFLNDYFKALISKGKDLVDINDLNVNIHKAIEMLPSEAAIEWNSVEKDGLPLVSDEYIVMIAYADKPTVLCFDADDGVFFEERIDLDEDVIFKITHWAEMPGKPDRK